MRAANPPGRLARAAGRASEDPFFFGSALSLFADVSGLDDEQVAVFLGCPSSELDRIRLCRRPDVSDDPEQFQREIGFIASRFNLDAERLAQIVRQAAFIEVLRAGADAAGAARRPAGTRELLLAAEDRAEGGRDDGGMPGDRQPPADIPKGIPEP